MHTTFTARGSRLTRPIYFMMICAVSTQYNKHYTNFTNAFLHRNRIFNRLKRLNSCSPPTWNWNRIENSRFRNPEHLEHSKPKLETRTCNRNPRNRFLHALYFGDWTLNNHVLESNFPRWQKRINQNQSFNMLTTKEFFLVLLFAMKSQQGSKVWRWDFEVSISLFSIFTLDFKCTVPTLPLSFGVYSIASSVFRFFLMIFQKIHHNI